VHCTKIVSELEFGAIGPNPGSPHPEMWHFAESQHKKNRETDVGMAGVVVSHATASSVNK